jgi:hypothetical protein
VTTTKWSSVTRIEEGVDECAGCGLEIPVGDLALMSTDCVDFFCFTCVTQAYEAMKAAQG